MHKVCWPLRTTDQLPSGEQPTIWGATAFPVQNKRCGGRFVPTHRPQSLQGIHSLPASHSPCSPTFIRLPVQSLQCQQIPTVPPAVHPAFLSFLRAFTLCAAPAVRGTYVHTLPIPALPTQQLLSPNPRPCHTSRQCMHTQHGRPIRTIMRGCNRVGDATPNNHCI
ncbi:hypothetical protein N656DRAFT_173643 [Canariomyces notabilis]|uniref:Uncharacterized protein n=1 Tax=Canariomyces notabilis TaxID=2074819 RepID=A0AAN6TBA5_9PEZI|nr:hypothetical protein N656DRAFT_173643 [Canariomyces arenarius]